MHVKAVVPGTEGVTHPDSGTPCAVHLCAPGLGAVKVASEPLSSRVRRPPPRAQMKECCSFYVINFCPEFQSPYLHFPSPCKQGWFKMECKTVC